jgi:hypothetical protein
MRRRSQRPGLKKQKKTTYKLRGRKCKISFKLMEARKWKWLKVEGAQQG